MTTARSPDLDPQSRPANDDGGTAGSRIVEALRQRDGTLGYIFVAERSRVLYVRVPKAACTTLLWALMELEGHDPAVVEASVKPLLSTPDVLVHDMDLYPVPTLADVSPELADGAVAAADWLRLAVVRNPYSRLYSAWESKILLNPPGNKKFSGAPPLVEEAGGVDVGASFRAFVHALGDNPQRWLTDRHFRLQSDLIPTEVIGDIELVPTGQIPELLQRLSRRAGATVTSRQSNEGLGINGTRFLDDRAASKVQEIYARDFELTGSDPAAFTPGDPIILDSIALQLIRLAGARSDRTIQLANTYKKISAQRAGSTTQKPTRRFRDALARIRKSK